MKASVARKYGWRPIVSEAEATALMRRELKRMRRKYHWSYAKAADYRGCWMDAANSFSKLLNIKVGTWYKFLPTFKGGRILGLLCDVVDDEKSPVSQRE